MCWGCVWVMNVGGWQGYVFSLLDRVAVRWESQPLHAPFPCLLPGRLHPSSDGPWTKLDLSVMKGTLVCVPRFEGRLLMGQVGGGGALPPWGWNWASPCMVEKQAVGNCFTFRRSCFPGWRPGMLFARGASSFSAESLQECFHRIACLAGARGLRVLVLCECPEWSLCELPAVEQFPPSPGDGQAISVEERGLSKSLVGSD